MNVPLPSTALTPYTLQNASPSVLTQTHGRGAESNALATNCLRMSTITPPQQRRTAAHAPMCGALRLLSRVAIQRRLWWETTGQGGKPRGSLRQGAPLRTK